MFNAIQFSIPFNEIIFLQESTLKSKREEQDESPSKDRIFGILVNLNDSIVVGQQD